MTLRQKDKSHSKKRKTTEYSLSRYFPKGTIYFYGFPAGESARFFNQVPPWKEELVAARPLICAGDNIKVLAFPASIDEGVWEIMTKHLKMPLAKKDQIISFPKSIKTNLSAKERNKAIKNFILTKPPENTLVMAQPYSSETLASRYLIESELSILLNDKINKKLYIPKKCLPERYQEFANGQEFAKDKKICPLPCVVKVSSSSAGDGVRICQTKKDYKNAKKDFENLKVEIFTEKFIKSVHNFGIQFGVSFDGKTEIIGHNEQLIDSAGSYLGGIIDPNKKGPTIKKIYKILLEKILPKIKKMGWFGVGGLDVLTDAKNNLYFIDPNFRMTAATSFLIANKNKKLKSALMSFMGEFIGSKKDFIKKICPLAKEGNKNQIIKIIALTKKKGAYGINAGVFFKSQEQLIETAEKLKKLGINSKSLDRIIASKSTSH